MNCLFVFQASYLVREQALWLPDALKAVGIDSQIVPTQDMILGRYRLPMPEDRAVVFVGSIAFCRHMGKEHHVVPGAYYSDTRYRCSDYLPDLPIGRLLNPMPVFVPAGMLRAITDRYFDLMGTNQLFIRPDSGAKVFSGFIVSRSGFDQEMKALDQLSGITDHTMVLLSSVKPIESEYRFVIVNGGVVTGSRYMLNGEISHCAETDARCLSLAQEMALLSRQVDLAYTCDICLSEGQAKVVEFNAFSTSGLYACDRMAAFTAVAEVAVLEHQELISLV